MSRKAKRERAQTRPEYGNPIGWRRRLAQKKMKKARKK